MNNAYSSYYRHLRWWLEPLPQLWRLSPLGRLDLPTRKLLLVVLVAGYGWYLVANAGVSVGRRLTDSTRTPAQLVASHQPVGVASSTLPGSDGTGAVAPAAPASTALAPFGTFRNSYAFGNCTWYVASRRRVPGDWGNAITWLGAARRAGWATGSSPALGAIAWSNQGRLGHVAVVTGISGNLVQVTEMNYLGFDRISNRWSAANSFQYIY